MDRVLPQHLFRRLDRNYGPNYGPNYGITVTGITVTVHLIVLMLKSLYCYETRKAIKCTVTIIARNCVIVEIVIMSP